MRPNTMPKSVSVTEPKAIFGGKRRRRAGHHSGLRAGKKRNCAIKTTIAEQDQFAHRCFAAFDRLIRGAGFAQGLHSGDEVGNWADFLFKFPTDEFDCARVNASSGELNEIPALAVTIAPNSATPDVNQKFRSRRQ